MLYRPVNTRKNGSKPVAIVTGGGRNIGRTIAMTLADAGYAVIVGYSHDARSASNTCRRINARGGTAFPFCADVRREEDIEDLFAFPNRQCGSPAVALVNNAAISYQSRLLSATAEEWSNVVLTDLCGPGLCAKHFARRLGNRSGAIVNIASTAGIFPLPRAPHYVGAKGGVIALTRSMALELAPRVRVNAVAPGLVGTQRHRKRCQTVSQILKVVPLHRLVRPSEIALTVMYLLDSRIGITGQTIVIDGGWSIGSTGLDSVR